MERSDSAPGTAGDRETFVVVMPAYNEQDNIPVLYDAVNRRRYS